MVWFDGFSHAPVLSLFSVFYVNWFLARESRILLRNFKTTVPWDCSISCDRCLWYDRYFVWRFWQDWGSSSDHHADCALLAKLPPFCDWRSRYFSRKLLTNTCTVIGVQAQHACRQNRLQKKQISLTRDYDKQNGEMRKSSTFSTIQKMIKSQHTVFLNETNGMEDGDTIIL